ncbi:MAG: carotenoid biosynthesis protein [Byssovorax sp.]
MLVLQLSCAAILGLFVVVRVGRDPDPARVLRRLALLAVASWIGEESCIHRYGFYFYSPDWSLPIDRVPLLIPLIWPIVILSAHDLARFVSRVNNRPPRAFVVPLLGAAIVLADASLIEPIAVASGLWTWTHPGLFAVPLIGIAGWSFFAGAAIAVFDRVDRAPSSRALREAAVLVVAPAATHALLLATWWLLFRWIQGPVAPWPVVALAWALSIALAAHAWRTEVRRRIPAVFMWLRVPAAGFFFALLALHGRSLAPLVAYALAFAPPYLAMTAWAPPRPS